MPYVTGRDLCAHVTDRDSCPQGRGNLIADSGDDPIIHLHHGAVEIQKDGAWRRIHVSIAR